MSFCKKKLQSCSKSRISEQASFASQAKNPHNSIKPRKASKLTKNGKFHFFSKKSCLKKTKKKIKRNIVLPKKSLKVSENRE